MQAFLDGLSKIGRAIGDLAKSRRPDTAPVLCLLDSVL